MILEGLTLRASAILNRTEIVGWRKPRSRREMYVLSNPLSIPKASCVRPRLFLNSLRRLPNFTSRPFIVCACEAEEV
jgi:hypothetical protein